jgi:hypothetical protein
VQLDRVRVSKRLSTRRLRHAHGIVENRSAGFDCGGQGEKERKVVLATEEQDLFVFSARINFRTPGTFLKISRMKSSGLPHFTATS